MKPRVAVTSGDPAGIGPEITLKALSQPEVHRNAKILMVGSRAVLETVAEGVSLALRFPAFKPGNSSWGSSHSTIPLYEVGNLTSDNFEPGQVAVLTGEESINYVQAAVQLGKEDLIDVMVTAPINKEAIRAAGGKHPGHTEILQSAFKKSRVETLFVVDNLRIFFLTRHISLGDAVKEVRKDRLIPLLEQAVAVLKDLGFEKPVIGVAGLNPHSGDGGLFGDEELKEIHPAIQEARSRGWDVRGPVGADSIFHQALRGRYDAVISLYHDQGHIAAKTYDFHRTVSVTTGLPILRTSVDHGTAFDIAGKGIADPTNMLEALKVGIDMAARRLKRKP